MRTLLAGIAFLTRLPVGRWISFDSADVARSAGWFPLIGVLLGLIYATATKVLRPHLPALVIAVLIVALDAILTGALHLDGLADAADGFGGGNDRDHVLRIMRDHAIGSYGATALIVVIVLKISAYSFLLPSGDYFFAIIAAAGLGRWSLVVLSVMQPYARSSPSVAAGIRLPALVWSTTVTLILVAAARDLRTCIAAILVLSITTCFGLYSRRRIGGITGDVLGANLEFCETAALLVWLWSR